MEKNAPTAAPPATFRFESYGVKVELRSADPALVEQAAGVCRKSLLGRLKPISSGRVDHVFRFEKTPSGTYKIFQNDEKVSSGRSNRKFFKLFDSVIRVAIGEYAVDRVFIHAGAVGWKGKAIVIPGDSFKGKSRLVTELIRLGAEYYSDEFAIVDEAGLMHNFPRPISLRTENYRAYEVPLDEIGAVIGETPIPIGLILFTEYVAGARWRPKMLSPGEGVLQLIQYALPITQQPEFTFGVLNNMARRAIITSSRRGSVETFAKTLLNFVDKHVD